jgi:predicted Rossmann-fold nucleotide-binding protein
MTGFDLPYEPIPRRLYTAADLFRGLDPGDPETYTQVVDFQIYRHYVKEGRGTPRNPYMGMMQALHDNAISEATLSYLEGRKVVGIIGDHKLSRASSTYRTAAGMARRLTRDGFLVCTGGGPGAMEAGHLGASFAGCSELDLDRAITRLGSHPVVPDLGRIVDADGDLDRGLVQQAFEWFKPSFELATSVEAPGESLAVPTWGYGHEPPAPFATHIAKYFQNSIREDGLLAIAQQGIICLEGKAGTLQEIFQDGAQNYYETFGQFSPMVFFGVDYWTRLYPVIGVLQTLFGERFASRVLVTDDSAEAVGFIERLSD